MKCELSIVKILWSNILFNRQIHKLFLKSIFDINFYKDIISKPKKDFNIAFVTMVGVTILCIFYNINVIYFLILLFTTALLNATYATYTLYKDVRPFCAPLCNAVGRTDFKRSIELTINEIADENYKPTAKRDAGIIDKLRQFEKEQT